MNPISNLYTTMMEKVMPILQEHWQLALVGIGVIFVLGAIFNWKWTWDSSGNRPFGFQVWVYRTFGEKGARINTGMIGVCIIACALTMWVLL